MKTFFVFSLGCKVNNYELQAIKSRLIDLGFSYNQNNPDYILINTCSVTATADQKSRQHIRKFKNKFPNAKIVVLGCYSQKNYKYINEEIDPFIVVGTTNKDKVVDLILKDKKTTLINDDIKTFKYEELGINNYSENTRAYLKIQDGCNNYCSYCLIPYLRGISRSRNPIDIIKEAEFLVKQGYQEIILTGIDIGSYGKDLPSFSFSDLIESLLDIPNLSSLRLSSIEISQIDEKFINLFSSRKNFAKHLHIPLQSGSDTILKRMNRKYTTDFFYKTIKSLKEKNPDFALTTDVIVGFPGESDDEFIDTYQFIKKCEFNMLHVFSYSKREGTVAAKMPNQVKNEIKKERSQRLINLSKEIWTNYCDKFLNKKIEILIEQYINGFNIGRSSNYIKVKIKGNESQVGKRLSIILKKDMIMSD